MATPLDIRRAHIARRHGMHNSLRIIIEAKRAGLPLSLAFALIEQESGDGRNVWGHDQAPNGGTFHVGGKTVTAQRYHEYKRMRGVRGQHGMQGVGPAQLTWWELQDRADALGGAHIPRYNIQVAFEHLADLRLQHGRVEGIRRYNGSGPAADRYMRQVQAKQRKWHTRLR